MKRVSDFTSCFLVIFSLVLTLPSCNSSGGGGFFGDKPPPTAPAVTITGPSDGSSFNAGDSISFTGTAIDTEDGDLSGSLSWQSDRDGPLGTGGSITVPLSTGGAHTITATATDSGGLTGTDQIGITINTAPVVTISAPPDGSSFTPGETVSFTGSASDNEDGDVPASLSWTSDRDGAIGTGGSFTKSDLSEGAHTITATAADSGGLTGTDQISLTVTANTGSVIGTVAGTTVVAVNQAGEIAGSDDTEGKTPDVQGNFSFTLTNIPVGQEVRLFLLTNGGIFPLYFGQPQTNVFILDQDIEVDLGFVAIVDDDYVLTFPNLAGQEGRAIPEKDPTELTEVRPEPEDASIPESLITPDTSGLTLGELLELGFEALEDLALLTAKTYFEAAFNLAGNSPSDDADTARIFFAVTRVGALAFDTYSDGNPDDEIDHLGDILDSLGCDPKDTARSNIDAIRCPALLPDDTVTGAQVQDFLNGPVLRELNGALDNIEPVSEAYERNLIFNTGEREESAEIDYRDVLVLRSALRTAVAATLIQSAYDLDTDIDAELNDPANTIESFLEDNSSFLSLLDASPLSIAKIELGQAADDLLAAIDGIQAETDDQTDDLITLLNATPEEIEEAKADILDFKNSLDGPVLVLDNEVPADPTNDFTLDLSKFFAGLNLRDFLPPFAGDQVGGLFPDPTFNGVFGPEIDLNEDQDFADIDATYEGDISGNGEVIIFSRGQSVGSGEVKQGIAVATKKGSGFTNASLSGAYTVVGLALNNFQDLSVREARILTLIPFFLGDGTWQGAFSDFLSDGVTEIGAAQGTYQVEDDGSFTFVVTTIDSSQIPPVAFSGDLSPGSGESFTLTGADASDLEIQFAVKIGSGFDNASLTGNHSFRALSFDSFASASPQAEIFTIPDMNFDGLGNWSGIRQSFTNNGSSGTESVEGTYSVNSEDGDLDLTVTSSGENFVGRIASGGSLIVATEQRVNTTVNQSITIATKKGGVFSNADLVGTYSFRSLDMDNFGSLLFPSRAFVRNAIIDFDGNGGWTGTFDEFESGGFSSTGNITGIYSVIPDGSVTLTITGGGDGIPDILQ